MQYPKLKTAILTMLVASSAFAAGCAMTPPEKKGIKYTADNMSKEANSNYVKGDLQAALVNLHGSLELNRALDNQPGIASNLNDIGCIFVRTKKYDEAMNYFKYASLYNMESGNLKGEASNYGNIGNVYEAQGDYANAKKYFEMALKLDKKAHDDSGIAARLNSLGRACYKSKDTKKAAAYFNDAVKAGKKLNDKSLLAASTNNLAIIYEDRKDYARAQKLYEEALRIDKENENIAAIAVDLLNLAVLHEKKGDYSRSVLFYERARMVNKYLGKEDKVRACSEAIARIKEQHASAGSETYATVDKNYDISDSIQALMSAGPAGAAKK